MGKHVLDEANTLQHAATRPGGSVLGAVPREYNRLAPAIPTPLYISKGVANSIHTPMRGHTEAVRTCVHATQSCTRCMVQWWHDGTDQWRARAAEATTEAHDAVTA